MNISRSITVMDWISLELHALPRYTILYNMSKNSNHDSYLQNGRAFSKICMCALVCYKYTVQEIPQLVRHPVGTEVGRWDPLFTFMARVKRLRTVQWSWSTKACVIDSRALPKTVCFVTNASAQMKIWKHSTTLQIAGMVLTSEVEDILEFERSPWWRVTAWICT